jgi:hypothetical protein
MDRFFAAPACNAIRIPIPGESSIDSCWMASDIGDNAPEQDGWFFAEETDTQQIWHKLERKRS